MIVLVVMRTRLLLPGVVVGIPVIVMRVLVMAMFVVNRRISMLVVTVRLLPVVVPMLMVIVSMLMVVVRMLVMTVRMLVMTVRMLMVVAPMLMVFVRMVVMTVPMLMVVLPMLMVSVPMLVVVLPMLMVSVPMLMVTVPMLLVIRRLPMAVCGQRDMRQGARNQSIKQCPALVRVHPIRREVPHRRRAADQTQQSPCKSSAHRTSDRPDQKRFWKAVHHDRQPQMIVPGPWPMAFVSMSRQRHAVEHRMDRQPQGHEQDGAAMHGGLHSMQHLLQQCGQSQSRQRRYANHPTTVSDGFGEHVQTDESDDGNNHEPIQQRRHRRRPGNAPKDDGRHHEGGQTGEKQHGRRESNMRCRLTQDQPRESVSIEDARRSHRPAAHRPSRSPADETPEEVKPGTGNTTDAARNRIRLDAAANHQKDPRPT